MSLKSTEELCVMTMKNDAKFEEKLRSSFMKLKKDTKFGKESTRRFKIGIRNLTNFDLSTRKSQRFSL